MASKRRVPKAEPATEEPAPVASDPVPAPVVKEVRNLTREQLALQVGEERARKMIP